MNFASRDYTRVRTFEGKGPTLVLGSGLGLRSDALDLVSEALQDMGHAHTLVDPPGFGYRDPKEAGVLLEESAMLAVDSDELPEGPRVYVGWSAGAMAAIEMAKYDPDAIGVVLINGLFDDLGRLFGQPWRYIWRYPLKTATMAALLYYLTGWLPRFVQQRLKLYRGLLGVLFWPMVRRPRKLSAMARRLLIQCRCKSAWQHLKANRHYQFTAELGASLEVPVLALVGTSDPLDTHPDNSAFLQACYRSRVVMLDAGHCLPLEKPTEVARLIAEFAKAFI